jgi:copper chaperone
MLAYEVFIEGMACGMCEAHISDTLRNTFPDIRRLTVSHRKNLASFISNEKLDEETLRDAIEKTGYRYRGCDVQPWEPKRKRLFRH